MIGALSFWLQKQKILGYSSCWNSKASLLYVDQGDGREGPADVVNDLKLY